MRAGKKKNKKKAKGKKEDKEARTTEVISETSGGCHAFLSLATRKNPPRACVERRDVRTRGGGPSWNGGSGRIRTGGRRSGGLRKKKLETELHRTTHRTRGKFAPWAEFMLVCIFVYSFIHFLCREKKGKVYVFSI